MFKCALFAALTIFVYYIYLNVLVYHELRAKKPEGFNDLVEVTELWKSFASAFVIYFYKRAVMAIVTPLFAPICKDQDDPELHEKRVKKAAIQFYKGTIQIVFTVWGYIVLGESEIYPQLMGGSDNCAKLLESTPPFTIPY